PLRRKAGGIRPSLEGAVRRTPSRLLRQPLLLRPDGAPGIPVAHGPASPRSGSPRMAAAFLRAALLEARSLAARLPRGRLDEASAKGVNRRVRTARARNRC